MAHCSKIVPIASIETRVFTSESQFIMFQSDRRPRIYRGRGEHFTDDNVF